MRKILLCLLGMLLFPCLVFAQAGTCVRTGEWCSQGPETRYINELAVYRDCWQWTDSYTCFDANNTDTCAPLRGVVGCYELAVSCAEANFQGQCVRWNTTMRCDHQEPTPPGATASAPIYTIISEQLVQSAQCQTLIVNKDCAKVGEVCTQGPETRVINGMPVYRDCWQTSDTYACVETQTAANYCQSIQANGCHEVQDGTYPKCVETAANGACLVYDRRYQCSAVPIVPLPTNVTIVSQVVNFVSEQVKPSAECTSMNNSGVCTKEGSEVCVEGPGTRNVNGVPTYRECWKYEQAYQCVSPENSTSDCNPLSANPKCTLVTTTCNNILPNGACSEVQKTYRCETKAAVNSQEEVCTKQQCDANGNCIEGDPDDPDFARAMTMMEMARQMATYIDADSGMVFSGDSHSCSKGNLGIVNCCKPKGGAQSNNSLSGALMSAAGSVIKEVADVGSHYVYDQITGNFETIQAGLGAMISGANNVGAAVGSGAAGTSGSLFNGSFDPSFSYMGFTAGFTGSAAAAGTVGGGLMGGNIAIGSVAVGESTSIAFTFNPYVMIAMLVIDWITSCEQEDYQVGMMKEQGLCHMVGTYCGSKVLGACVQTREGHCCYNSKLAKIVQEQGRPQIMKSWGTAEEPQCGGFTLEEFARIDFSKMDLSEFFKEIIARQPNLAPGSARALENITNSTRNYFGTPTGNAPTYNQQLNRQ